MKVYEELTLTIQRAIGVGSLIWFVSMIIFVHPTWPEELHDILLLLVINIGYASLIMLVHLALYVTIGKKRR